MGDYTQQQVYLVAVPEGAPVEAFEAVASVLEDHGWGQDWGSAPGWGGTWTVEAVRGLVGADFPATVHDGRLGELVGDVAEVLAAQGFTFYGWEDPRYEFPGEYVAHVPALGLFTGSCDADGNVTLTAYELRELIDQAETLDALRETIRARTGQAWAEALRPPVEVAG